MSHICDYPVGSVCSLCSRSSLLMPQRRAQPASLIERHRYSQLRRTEALGHQAALGRCHSRELIECHQHRDRKEGRMGGHSRVGCGLPRQTASSSRDRAYSQYLRDQSAWVTEWLVRTNARPSWHSRCCSQSSYQVYSITHIKGFTQNGSGLAWLTRLTCGLGDENMYARYVPGRWLHP